MNAFDLYKNHNQTISHYLVIYVIVIAALVLTAFLLYRYAATPGIRSFYKSLFFTLLIAGAVLAGSALNFRANNTREINTMQVQYQQYPEKFVAERFESASQYKPHFYRLLTIWCISVATLSLLMMLLWSKRVLAAVCMGLAICVLASLALDFAGFLSDARYYNDLKKLTLTKNN